MLAGAQGLIAYHPFFIGMNVKACNTHKMNCSDDCDLFAADSFYEEGKIINIHNEHTVDVQFPDGSILHGARTKAFK